MVVQEIRASALARAMGCKGSLFFKDLIVEEAGDAAREGTAAGELLQAMVEQNTLEPKVKATASNGFLFDSDMSFHLRPIAERMWAVAGQSPITCEERIDWMTPSGIKIRGQYDQSYIVGPTLFVDDLKYGWGIVEAKGNWQLLAYAIGRVFKEYQATGYIPETIVLTINQPRPHHEDGDTRSWVLTYTELMGYYNQICKRMEEIAAGQSELTTGSHCKYCPAAAEACGAFNRACNNALDVVLSEHIQDYLTDEQIAKQIELFNRASEILKIKKDSLKTLAINRIKNGSIIPGYSMTESFGHRSWVNGIDPTDIEVLEGIKVTKQEYISPAQAEKLGVSKSLIDSMSTRYSKGFDLKPVDIDVKAAKIFGKR